MMMALQRIRCCRKAATAIEYGLLAFLIAVSIISAAAYAGQNVKQTFCRVAGGLTPGVGPCGIGISRTFPGLPPLKAPVVCTGEMTAADLTSDEGAVPMMCMSGRNYYAATSLYVTQSYDQNSNGSLIPAGVYTYSSTLQTSSGTSVTITSTYNSNTGASSLTPKSTPYPNSAGPGTCINEKLSKLTASQRTLAGFGGSAGEGFWSNAVASVCTAQ